MCSAKVQRKPFTFLFPVKRKVTRNLRFTTEIIGNLTITGTAYFDPRVSPFDEDNARFGVDMDSITFDGNLKDLLEVSPDMETIEDAALRHASELFTSQEREVA